MLAFVHMHGHILLVSHRTLTNAWTFLSICEGGLEKLKSFQIEQGGACPSLFLMFEGERSNLFLYPIQY